MNCSSHKAPQVSDINGISQTTERNGGYESQGEYEDEEDEEVEDQRANKKINITATRNNNHTIFKFSHMDFTADVACIQYNILLFPIIKYKTCEYPIRPAHTPIHTYIPKPKHYHLVSFNRFSFFLFHNVTANTTRTKQINKKKIANAIVGVLCAFIFELFRLSFIFLNI